MEIIAQIAFIIILGITIFLFSKSVKTIRRNILLGKPEKLNDQKNLRWRNMTLYALGQKKMFKKPIPAFLHLLIYVGFILINIEILEIILDGILGTHRLFAPAFGGAYKFFISFFEILAVGVLVSCVAFLFRRNVLHVKRFESKEMTSWPKLDANIILIAEIILMVAILTMNGADLALQKLGSNHYLKTGNFLVSEFIAPIFSGIQEGNLIVIERIAWWGHIAGIFAFLVYIPYSKHFHIFISFPNTWYRRLEPQGKMINMPEITKEVKLMLDPSAAGEASDAPPPDSFGAKDATDLSWKNLMDAYSCTECGRCTAACPANLTGKKLSPRKIMMDTRDRIEEIGHGIDKQGKDFKDDKSLLGDYITDEEINACTTCQACVEACPVSINPLDIILRLRRYNVMEASKAPSQWNVMFGNIENNAAPWAYPQDDRLKWAEE